MKSRRWIPLLLAVTLFMSAFAGIASAEEASDDIMTPLGKYPEMVTVTMSKVSQPNPHFPEGKSSSDNVLLDWLRERMNVDVKILWEADGSEYINRLSLAIASDDMPDIMWIGNSDYTTLQMLVENDMIADLTEVYEKCTGDFIRSTHKSFGGRNLEPLTFDGKLMAFPGASIGYGHEILWIRKDWLDKLNLEVPTTLEKIQNVAREFIAKDPGENGPGNTVGIALSALDPVGGYGNQFGTNPIFNMLGAYPRQWMTDEEGKVYYGSTQPEMKEGLRIIREMYEEGLFDASFMTRTNPGETGAFINSNQVGMFFGPWWIAFDRQDLAKQHPESDWIAVNAPLDADGKFKHMQPSPTANFLVVRKDYEHPELVVKMLNLCQGISRNLMEGGEEAYRPYAELGTSWTAIFPTGDINIEYFDIVPKTGHYIAKYLEDNSFDGDELTNDQDRRIWRYTQEYMESRDPESPGWGEYYARYIGSTILDAPENVPVESAFYYSTDSFSKYWADLKKLEDEMYLKIIVGEKPLEYFDEFVSQWYTIGGDTLITEVQAVVDAK